jgi:hypothetical protein
MRETPLLQRGGLSKNNDRLKNISIEQVLKRKSLRLNYDK